MNYLGVSGISRFFVGLKGFYSGINGATLTGAIDVIVVEQENGSFKCSPFHVRFGKLGVLRSREKVVDIEVNGIAVPIRMKLGDSGEAFFVEEINAYDELNDETLATSPLPMSPRHSDSDHKLGRLKVRQDTEDSVDESLINPPTVMGGDSGIKITILEEKVESLVKAEDPKCRKRRKKRKRNPGSKFDISTNVSQSESRTSILQEDAMFTMDEDLEKVNEALSNLDLSNYGTNVTHSRSFHRDFYSDTEVDATCTPQNSRPSTPIQSDSEYEITKFTKDNNEEEGGKWAWGEFPSPIGNVVSTPLMTSAPQPTHPQSNVPQQSNQKSSSDENALTSDYESRNRSGSENKSMLSGMFSFMKRNPRQKSGGNPGPSEHGMYLDDINPDNMDPDQFALYFPNVVRDKDYFRPEQDEDVESGKGYSLPQSPQPGSSPKDSQFSVYMDDSQRQRNEPISEGSVDTVTGSLMLSCLTGAIPNLEAISLCGNNLGLFEQSKLTYDDLTENPDVIMKASPDSIVVKIDGKYVSWPAALPTLLSATFFKRPLPEQVYQKLLDQYAKKEETMTDQPETIVKENESKKQGRWYFPWARSNSTNASVVSDDSRSQPSSPEGNSKSNSPRETRMNKESSATLNTIRAGTGTSSSDESEGGGGLDEGNKSGRSSRRDVHTVINISQSSIPVLGAEKYKKTLRMSSDQIRLLGLKYGQNEAVFSVTTAYQGTTSARCHIYLWKHDYRVVISDIDGTITKSDVLGHVLPMIGNDWSQSGVAQLFTQIQSNGYNMLYLSSRSIGQASSTRNYLRSIKQDDVTLPDGPLLLNPTSLMSAFRREVIERCPEKFKIACLKDVQLLFPKNPFYAGYGNKINDVMAYHGVEVAIPRIFTINHHGELRHALTNTFQSSYTNLTELVEHIFPVYKDKTQGEADGFSTFEFWREPIQELPPMGLEMMKPEIPTRPRRSV